MIERKQDGEFVVISNGMVGYGFREQSLWDAVKAGVLLIVGSAGGAGGPRDADAYGAQQHAPLLDMPALP